MNQHHQYVSELLVLSSLLGDSNYMRSPLRIHESERRSRRIGQMIRKGRNTIAQKQAFLRATSKQKKVLWRHSPLNPNRISVE